MKQKETGELVKQFRNIWVSFNANMNSLWAYCNQISTFADQWDYDLAKKISYEIGDLIKDNPIDIQNELVSLIDLINESEIEPDFEDNNDIREFLTSIQTENIHHKIQTWVSINPKKAFRFNEVFQHALEQPPANGILLRRSALIILISYIEELVRNLIKIWQTINPESGDKKNHKNFPNHLKYLELTGIEFPNLYNKIAIVQEAILRRNLLTHNNGIIDQHYIENIPSNFQMKANYKINKRISVPQKYLNDALDNIHFLGFALHQHCWRVWFPNDCIASDTEYAMFIYSALRSKRHNLVELLNSYTGNFPIKKETLHTIKINYCIALRDRKEIDDIEIIVTSILKQKPSWRIKLAITVLQGNFRQTQLMLTDGNQTGKINTISEKWELFEPISQAT